MSFAGQGLTHFDINRIIYSLNENDDREDEDDINYSEWYNFLDKENFKNKNKKSKDKNQKESHQCKKSLNWDYDLVHITYYESIEGDKFSLKPEMRKFINNKTMNDPKIKNLCVNQYLKYMCVLTRQLLSTIKHDFDPYLLTNDIDNGIWS